MKSKGIIKDMDKSRINTMRYKFGSNNLFIGSAIVKVLERLEQNMIYLSMSCKEIKVHTSKTHY